METLIHKQSLSKFSHQSLILFFILGGFLPVSSIVIHCLHILPLHLCLLFIIAPAILLFTGFGIKIPAIGKTVIVGFLAGVVAVFLYDLSRLPYILNGWTDFIPKIGGWINNTQQSNALLGYLWRYIGNGGGMGITFFILMAQFSNRKNLLLKGILFGLFIFACLMLVLCLFAEAQLMMFKITPLSFTGSFTGHIIYGAVLGITAKKYF